MIRREGSFIVHSYFMWNNIPPTKNIPFECQLRSKFHENGIKLGIQHTSNVVWKVGQIAQIMLATMFTLHTVFIHHDCNVGICNFHKQTKIANRTI